MEVLNKNHNKNIPLSDKRERANEVCDFTAKGLISESPCSFSSPHEEAVVDIKDETFFEGICYKHSFSAFFFFLKKKNLMGER